MCPTWNCFVLDNGTIVTPPIGNTFYILWQLTDLVSLTTPDQILLKISISCVAFAFILLALVATTGVLHARNVDFKLAFFVVWTCAFAITDNLMVWDYGRSTDTGRLFPWLQFMGVSLGSIYVYFLRTDWNYFMLLLIVGENVAGLVLAYTVPTSLVNFSCLFAFLLADCIFPWFVHSFDTSPPWAREYPLRLLYDGLKLTHVGICATGLALTIVSYQYSFDVEILFTTDIFLMTCWMLVDVFYLSVVPGYKKI